MEGYKSNAVFILKGGPMIASGSAKHSACYGKPGASIA